MYYFAVSWNHGWHSSHCWLPYFSSSCISLYLQCKELVQGRGWRAANGTRSDVNTTAVTILGYGLWKSPDTNSAISRNKCLCIFCFMNIYKIRVIDWKLQPVLNNIQAWRCLSCSLFTFLGEILKHLKCYGNKYTFPPWREDSPIIHGKETLTSVVEVCECVASVLETNTFKGKECLALFKCPLSHN